MIHLLTQCVELEMSLHTRQDRLHEPHYKGGKRKLKPTGDFCLIVLGIVSIQ